jgi:putative ABC transport system substrate-binding protein
MGWVVVFWLLDAWTMHYLINICLCFLFLDTPPDEPWKFGVLFWHDSPNDVMAFNGIEKALAETGMKHALIKRNAHSEPDAVRSILEEFRKEKVDLIFAMGTEAALHAGGMEKETPIVFTAVTNPVVSEVVTSWNQSGNNMAGNSNWIASETVLHVFQLAVPDLERLGILRSKTEGKVSAAELKSMRDYLRQPDAPDVVIAEAMVSGNGAIPDAVAQLAQSRVQAIWIPIDREIYNNMDKVTEAAGRHRIPLVSSSLKGIQGGAFAGVVVDYELLGMRAMVIAKEILDGKKRPGEIPIGRMHGYLVQVNLGAARAAKYELPLSLLVLADAIIDDQGGEDAK